MNSNSVDIKVQVIAKSMLYLWANSEAALQFIIHELPKYGQLATPVAGITDYWILSLSLLYDAEAVKAFILGYPNTKALFPSHEIAYKLMSTDTLYQLATASEDAANFLSEKLPALGTLYPPNKNQSYWTFFANNSQDARQATMLIDNYTAQKDMA